MARAARLSFFFLLASGEGMVQSPQSVITLFTLSQRGLGRVTRVLLARFQRSQQNQFETEMLAEEDNFRSLAGIHSGEQDITEWSARPIGNPRYKLVVRSLPKQLALQTRLAIAFSGGQA